MSSEFGTGLDGSRPPVPPQRKSAACVGYSGSAPDTGRIRQPREASGSLLWTLIILRVDYKVKSIGCVRRSYRSSMRQRLSAEKRAGTASRRMERLGEGERGVEVWTSK